MHHAGLINRRKFMRLSALSSVVALPGLSLSGAEPAGRPDLIKKIDTSVIWKGAHEGRAGSWFHPRACMVPENGKLVAMMTCQSISGSDVFGQVFWSRSADNGNSWSDPRSVASLGRRRLPNGNEEGVCDVVPEYHEATKSVLAVGHNVYYKNNVLTKPHENRFPVYVTGDAAGNWSERKKLEWEHPETSGIYTCGCGQRVTLENGNILIPISYGAKERQARKVCTLVCSFDGRELKPVKSGPPLELNVKRGLLEPSMTSLNGMFYMTIRAEDGHGYVTSSNDGVGWNAIKPWCWDDGEPLTMSTTQQHWMTHSHGLYLVYTRKSRNNVNAFRWRAPLYTAMVDPQKLCLIRSTEKVVFPLIGDGINKPHQVRNMGNFHVVNASISESWVTVGEVAPGWKGNTLLGRVRWSRENERVND